MRDDKDKLHPLQAQVMRAILQWDSNHTYAPSIQDLADMLGRPNASAAVHMTLNALERKGWISRVRGIPGWITILRRDIDKGGESDNDAR